MLKIPRENMQIFNIKNNNNNFVHLRYVISRTGEPGKHHDQLSWNYILPISALTKIIALMKNSTMHGIFFGVHVRLIYLNTYIT